jgi:hypothetical protein
MGQRSGTGAAIGAIAGLALAPFTAGTSLAMTAATAAAIGGGIGGAVGMAGDTRQGDKAAKTAKSIAEGQNAAAISYAKGMEAKSSSLASETIASQKRAAARSRTIFTSPLGLSEQAMTASKTLLGQ